MTREERRLRYPNPKPFINKPETKHIFIGGWENFDLDYFTRKGEKRLIRG